MLLWHQADFQYISNSAQGIMKVRSEFHGYFLRAILPSTAIASNGSQQEDKSGDDSNNKVSFSTIIRRLGQCITVIVMV